MHFWTSIYLAINRGNLPYQINLSCCCLYGIFETEALLSNQVKAKIKNNNCNKPNKFTCTNFELREFKAARISLEKVREIKSREFKAERKWVPRKFKYK